METDNDLCEWREEGLGQNRRNGTNRRVVLWGLTAVGLKNLVCYVFLVALALSSVFATIAVSKMPSSDFCERVTSVLCVVGLGQFVLSLLSIIAVFHLPTRR